MRQLLVVRHGQTAWNAEGRWQGWLDVELDEIGLDQARRRARQLAASGLAVAGVASSPLARALTTARSIADALGVADVRTHPGLRERNGGEWQGMTGAEIDARWPDELAALRRGEIDAPPGGESNTELLARLNEALADLDASMPDGPIVIVTHGGIARALVNETGTAQTGVFANVGGMWIDYDAGRVRAGDALPPLEHDPAFEHGHTGTPVAPEIVASDAAGKTLPSN